jgi:ketosteroid isomerase-like protein
MKKLLMILPLALILCFMVGCQDKEAMAELEAIEAEVRARSKVAVAAEMAFDWETAITFFTSDVVIQPANAPQFQGREALLELYQTGFTTMTEFEGTTTAIIPAASGDMAYEYGVNRFVFKTPDGPVESFGKYLLVWTKVDRKWLIAALSFSNDAPPSE